MRIIGIFAAALVLAQAGAALAAEPSDPSDTRCLALTVALAGSGDPKMEQAGAMAALYFLGRVDGAAPGADLKAALKEEAGRLSALPTAEVSAQTSRCGAILKARGEAVTRIGNEIQAEAK